MKSIYISFIVPCYNAAKYLTDLIKSVQNQTNSNWELILIDDGSTDNTREIVDIFLNDKRIHYIYQNNNGVSNARNHGLKEARGEYITFIDADDWIEKNFVESISHVDLANINICGYREIYPNGKIKTQCKPSFIYSNSPLETYTVRNSYFRTPWAVVFKHDFINENHLSFREDLTWGEDTIFLLLTTIKAENICFIPDVIYNYRYTGEGLTNSPMRHTNMVKFLDNYVLYKEQVYSKSRNAAKMMDELILFLSIILLNEVVKSDKPDQDKIEILGKIHKFLRELPFSYILRTKVGRIRYIAAIFSRIVNVNFSLFVYKHIV